MIFIILGFVMATGLLTWLSLLVAAILRFGGLDCGPLPIKNCIYMLPIIVILSIGWYTLFRFSPFGIVVQ